VGTHDTRHHCNTHQTDLGCSDITLKNRRVRGKANLVGFYNTEETPYWCILSMAATTKFALKALHHR